MMNSGYHGAHTVLPRRCQLWRWCCADCWDWLPDLHRLLPLSADRPCPVCERLPCRWASGQPQEWRDRSRADGHCTPSGTCQTSAEQTIGTQMQCNREQKCAENYNAIGILVTSNHNSFRVLFDIIALVHFMWKICYLQWELTSPGNQHCASCIDALSYPVTTTWVKNSAALYTADYRKQQLRRVFVSDRSFKSIPSSIQEEMSWFSNTWFSCDWFCQDDLLTSIGVHNFAVL